MSTRNPLDICLTLSADVRVILGLSDGYSAVTILIIFATLRLYVRCSDWSIHLVCLSKVLMGFVSSWSKILLYLLYGYRTQSFPSKTTPPHQILLLLISLAKTSFFLSWYGYFKWYNLGKVEPLVYRRTN